MGGDYPFILTSGHNRWSIHALNIAQRTMLRRTVTARTHTDQPRRCRSEGDPDHEEVRVTRYRLAPRPAKLSPRCGRPADPVQRLETYQFRGGSGTNAIEAGMVNGEFAGGYGTSEYWPAGRSPTPMRGSRVDIAKMD
jgi:hypothetical protein